MWTLVKVVLSPSAKVTKTDLQTAVQNMGLLLRSQADKLPWWKGGSHQSAIMFCWLAAYRSPILPSNSQ